MALKRDGPDMDWCKAQIAEAIPWPHKFDMIRADAEFSWIFRLLVNPESHPKGIHIMWRHEMDEWKPEHFNQALETVLYRLQEHIDKEEIT